MMTFEPQDPDYVNMEIESMIDEDTIVAVLGKLKAAYPGSMTTGMEREVKSAIDVLEWVLGLEPTSPFDYIGLEE